ncbi:helix-turn-helix domain-containing protein [Leifsonia sp. McL0607]|uniref:helix-turn-helix domain-containing protein n=1 Tax=Leifsonia sp. McL0607 TaxID=3415672 RepID=UPI003CE84231
MTESIGYDWRLREQMAAAGMFHATKLMPELEARGIHLSPSQVHRLVSERPERLNLHVLVALTDILGCRADDLIVPVKLGAAGHAEEAATGTDTATSTIRARDLRPQRARLTDQP